MQQFNINIADYKLIFVGIFLFMHGFVYFNLSRGIFSNPDNQLSPSLLLGKLLNKSSLDLIVKGLWFLAGLGFIVGGIYLVFIQETTELINIILLVTSIIGILSFLLYWDGVVKNSVTAGLIGVVIDIGVILLIIFFQ